MPLSGGMCSFSFLAGEGEGGMRVGPPAHQGIKDFWMVETERGWWSWSGETHEQGAVGLGVFGMRGWPRAVA